jgi:hypothetical protein
MKIASETAQGEKPKRTPEQLYELDVAGVFFCGRIEWG